jgi:hypothetical protein
MTKKYNPELGQYLFGNPTGNFQIENYQEALIVYLIEEIRIAFWNKFQKDWEDSEDPKLNGVTYNYYYWGENEEESKKPNLKFSHSPQEIRWYKYPGRGMSCTIKMNEKQWRKWFDKALEIIWSDDDAGN